MRKIDARLLSAAHFVRQGAVFADIGTDHGYLPIFLLESGRISRAVCSDINAGPLDSAKRNALEHSLTDKIDFILTDGAQGLDVYGATDIAVCGMGGELIGRIISSAPFLKKTGLRLILQPMSRQELLRRCLYSEGFEIIGERYSYADGKYYLCICAEYVGTRAEIPDTLATLGIVPDADLSVYEGYLRTKRQALLKAMEGKRLGKEDFQSEENLINEIDSRIKSLNIGG